MALEFGVVLSGDTHAAWESALEPTDRSGFWGLGMGDSPSLYPDTYVRCSVAALLTSNVRVGPWVTNPVTRHPAVTAGAIASVDQVSGGRAFLGIGSGDSAVRNIELPPARLADFEAYVHAVRGLLETGEAIWRGRRCRLQIGQRGVPIIVAAAGPKTLELGGRVGDGVVVVGGLDPHTMDRAREAIDRGARSVGRTIDDVHVWWLVLANLAEDDATALREMRNSLATFAHLSIRSREVIASLPQDVRDRVLEVRDRYRPIEHGAFGDTHNARLTDELGVTEFLAHRFALVGSPPTVRARLREIQELGADRLWLALRVPDKQRILRLWRDEVLPDIAPAAAGGTV